MKHILYARKVNEQLFTLTASEFDMPRLVEDCVSKRRMGFGVE